MRGKHVRARWAAQMDALGGRAARRGFSYHAYVPTAIGDEDFLLSSQIAAAAMNAEHATRALNEDPPGQLNFEALARQLLRAESVASSRIEGLVLSHRRLAKAEFSVDGRDITAQGVLANIRALEQAVGMASAVDEVRRTHIIEVHRTLLQGTRDERLGGVVRETQNWIGGDATSPRNADFVPPPPELVLDLLDDLCVFLNRDDVPAVIQAAIAHVQFETIHPFHDGNGRVGRAVILSVLRRRGLAPRYLPPVEPRAGERCGSLRGRPEQLSVRRLRSWYRIFVDAVYNAAIGAREFARRVADLQLQWIEAAGTPHAWFRC